MKNIYSFIVALLFILQHAAAQVEYISGKAHSLNIDDATFYVVQVKDARSDTSNIGNTYSMAASKFVPMQPAGGTSFFISNILSDSLTSADSNRLAVRIIIRYFAIKEDTTRYRKKANVGITLGVEKMFDGQWQECYSGSATTDVTAALSKNADSAYAPSMALVLHDFLQAFNAQVLNKAISKQTVTVISGVTFGHIKPAGSDTLTWSATRPLQPEDFTAEVPRGAKKGDVLSASASDFSVSVRSFDDTAGRVIVVNTGTLFIKHLSWIKPRIKDENILPFEQMRFDLARLYEIRFVKYLKNYTFIFSRFNEQFNTIYNDFHNRLGDEVNAMVQDCRYATANVISKRNIAGWRAKITAALKAEDFSW